MGARVFGCKGLHPATAGRKKIGKMRGEKGGKRRRRGGRRREKGKRREGKEKGKGERRKRRKKVLEGSS